jgi:AcrR family transcriptional regulator
MSRPATHLEPPSVRIAAEIRRRILAGLLRPGDRVPSARQITVEWHVAIATASKVLAALGDEGLVRAVPGVGTVVAGAASPTGLARADAGAGLAGDVRLARGVGGNGADRGFGHAQPSSVTARAVADRADLALRPRRVRDPEHEMSRERVVEVAIKIADAEGMASLSMRRVANELGIATMSVYRYVPGKDELVELMADRVLAEDQLPNPAPPGWRAQLEATAQLQWAVYKRHPWLAPVISMTRPQILPHGLVHTEWALRALSGLVLDPNTRLHAAITLFNYVRGTAVSLEAEAEAQQETGITDDEWMEAQSSALEQVLNTGSYPAFARLMAEPGLDLNLDSLFEFGLQELLDGLTALIARSATQ